MPSRPPDSSPIDHEPTTWRSITFVSLISLLMGLMLLLSTACMPPQVQPPPTATRGTRIPLANYKNKIAFKSDRDGGEAIYIMNPDGSGQARLEDESLYYEALKLESFSPDRSQTAFVRLLDGNYDIFVRDTRGSWTRQLVTGLAADYQPAWSPDGAHIAYVSEAEGAASIWVTDAAGEESQKLTNPLQWKDKHPSWSPDGTRIAFWSDREGRMQIWLMDANGANQTNISRSQANDWDPVWIKAEPAVVPTPTPTPGGPDDLGIGIAVSGYNLELSLGDNSGGYAPITKVILLVDGEEVYNSGPLEVDLHRQTIRLEPTPGPRQVEVRAWNKGYYAADPKVLAQELVCVEPTLTPTPTSTPAPTPTPTFIVVTSVPTPESVFAAATISAKATADALTIGTATPTPPYFVTATPTPKLIVVTSTPTPANLATAVYQAALATAIAFTTGTPTPTPPYMVTATPTPVLVYLDDMDGIALYMPTPTPVPTPTPTAIPRVLVGKIAFKSDRSGEEAIYVMNPDGSGVALLTSEWPYDAALARESFSPDGRYMAFVKEAGGAAQLFLLDFEGRTERQLTHMGAGSASWGPAWSPDGHWIAFTSNQSGNDEIWVINRDGKGARQLTKNAWEWDKHPSWSPDGRQITYWSNVGTAHRQIWVMNADGSGQRNISNNQYNDWDPVWIKGLWPIPVLTPTP